MEPSKLLPRAGNPPEPLGVTTEKKIIWVYVITIIYQQDKPSIPLIVAKGTIPSLIGGFRMYRWCRWWRPPGHSGRWRHVATAVLAGPRGTGCCHVFLSSGKKMLCQWKRWDVQLIGCFGCYNLFLKMCSWVLCFCHDLVPSILIQASQDGSVSFLLDDQRPREPTALTRYWSVKKGWMQNIHGNPVDLALSLILCTTCILDGNWNLLKWCWWLLFSMVFCVPSSHKYLCFCATYICLPMGKFFLCEKKAPASSVTSSSISQPTAKTILCI